MKTDNGMIKRAGDCNDKKNYICEIPASATSTFSIITSRRLHLHIIAKVAQAQYKSPEQHYSMQLIVYSYGNNHIRRCLKIVTFFLKCEMYIMFFLLSFRLGFSG